jgi:hypothetical protein
MNKEAIAYRKDVIEHYDDFYAKYWKSPNILEMRHFLYSSVVINIDFTMINIVFTCVFTSIGPLMRFNFHKILKLRELAKNFFKFQIGDES